MIQTTPFIVVTNQSINTTPLAQPAHLILCRGFWPVLPVRNAPHGSLCKGARRSGHTAFVNTGMDSAF